jgi:hypothetical protein
MLPMDCTHNARVELNMSVGQRRRNTHGQVDVSLIVLIVLIVLIPGSVVSRTFGSRFIT